MRVLFDCSNITVGGGIQVANSFLKYAFKSSEVKYCFLLSKQAYESLTEADKASVKDLNVINTNPYTLIPGHKSIQKIRTIERNFGPDLTFTLFGPAYWKSKVPHLVGFARPHYILHHSPFFRIGKNSKLIRYMRFLEFIHNYLFRINSDFLFVENESMLNSLQKKYLKKVFYIPNTYNQVFENHVPEEKLKSNSEFRLLTISSNYPHKNLDSIPLVSTILERKYPDFRFKFIVTIKEDADKISTDHISYVGSVGIEECPKLYQDSDAMYLPTLLECFSASYVEAMYMKLPILTSDLDFLKSICSDAALYFDPLNAENIADQIYSLASDKEKQNSLIEKGKHRLAIFGTPKDRYDSFVKLFLKIIGEQSQ